MRNLNGFRQLNGLKLAFATALLVTFVGGTANADIVIDNTAIVIDNQTIPTTDIVSMRISNGILNINVTGWTVTKNASTPGGVVVNLSASSSSIATGQSVTLNWSTTNADSCTASGGFGGWAGSVISRPDGSLPVTSTAANTYRFTLSCINSTTTAEDWVDVTVSDPPPPSPGNCTTLSNTATPREWTEFWGAAFPQTANPIKRLDIGRSGYNYISFNTGDANGNGAVLLIETTTSPDGRIGSISTCPGDFEVADVCKGRWGVVDWIAYSTNGMVGTCQLSSDTDYYINFTFTNGKDASTSTCSSSRCLVEIQASFRVRAQ